MSAYFSFMIDVLELKVQPVEVSEVSGEEENAGETSTEGDVNEEGSESKTETISKAEAKQQFEK